MDDIAKDSRFAHIGNDPRFKSIPRSQRKVKIDKRFQSMFKDKRFKLKYTVDKRGRPITRTSNEDLERYYELSSGSDDSDGDDATVNENESENEDQQPTKKKQNVTEKGKPSGKNDRARKIDKSTSIDKEQSDSENETDGSEEGSDDGTDQDLEDVVRSDDEEISDSVKSKLQDLSVDFARGEGALLSDSSSDEESSEDDEEVTVEHGWGELDKDAERTDEVTHRLAVCNMDWDRIRAVDLMVLFNSFIPAGGLVRSIAIYPSEFGLERMRKEEEQGPTELVEHSTEKDDDDDDDDGSTKADDGEENEEGSRYHMEKLRKYQLNRLKYYYAIVECDNANTANHIYEECDGMEYESSATRLDLRFVPDGTVFDQEPREICTETPDTKKYRPRHFTTTALQQAKVELTWDETDPTRTEITNRLLAGDDVDDNDLKAYLASSSEDEGSDVNDEHDKHSGKNNTHSTKIKNDGKSFNKTESNDSSDSEDGDPISKYRSLLAQIEEDEEKKKNRDVQMEVSWGLGLKEKAEEAVKKRLASAEERTPFQEMMEKRKQKKKEKKNLKLQQKMEAKSKEGSSEEENPYSDDDIPSDIDLNDPYFAEELKNDSQKKSSKGNKKKNQKQDETEEEKLKKAELELLLMEKDNQKHFNFKKIQEAEENDGKKKKKKWRNKSKEAKAAGAQARDGDDFEVNVNDERFSALFSSHHYNIDPTDSHFRKSKGMDALITAKQKQLVEATDQPPRKVARTNGSDASDAKSRRDPELSVLVKSVKRKAQSLKR